MLRPFIPINAPALPSTIDKSQVSSSPSADGAANFISFVEPSGCAREEMCLKGKRNFLLLPRKLSISQCYLYIIFRPRSRQRTEDAMQFDQFCSLMKFSIEIVMISYSGLGLEWDWASPVSDSYEKFIAVLCKAFQLAAFVKEVMLREQRM